MEARKGGNNGGGNNGDWLKARVSEGDAAVSVDAKASPGPCRCHDRDLEYLMTYVNVEGDAVKVHRCEICRRRIEINSFTGRRTAGR